MKNSLALKRMLLLFGLLFCFSMGDIATAQQDKLDENLRAAIKQADPGEHLRIIIILSEKPSRTELQGLVFNKQKEEKRHIVVSYLKHFTRSRQAALLEELHSYQAEGFAKDIQPLWIVNVVTAKLSSSIINNLAQRQDVEKLVLEKISHAASSTTWSVDSVKAPTVWSDINLTGEDVLIAILDTGVDYNHSDLSSNIWINEDEENGDVTVDDDSNGFIDDIRGWDFFNDDSNPIDDEGHGTHVSGIAAGDGTGGTQTGVAPNAKLMALKIWEFGEGSPSECIEALEYALENGADVINISGGWLNSDISENERSDLREACESVVDAGVTVVAAAGNEDWYTPPNQMKTPASVPCVIAVGAIDSDNDIYYKSARGPVTWYFDPYYDYYYPPGLIKPDVVAPGQLVNSTKLNGGYINNTGTSMASPAVAGTVALMLEAYPELLPADIKDILESTALDLGTAGKDNTFGSGRIDAYKAVLIALAKNNKSIHSVATGYNGGRRAAVTSDDDLHLVFQSGYEVFYGISDDDGSSWDSIERLSDGEGASHANRFPSLTVDDNDNVFVVWQRFSTMDGYNSDYEIWFTSAPTVPTTPIVAANQYSSIPTYYPYPVITHDVDNDHLVVVYHDNSGIRWLRSTDGGSSWNSPATISGTSGNNNSSIISNDDETLLTYDDLSTVYSRFYTGSGWTSEEDVTDGSGLSAERFSSAAVSKTTGWVTSYMWHVVWQAYDPSESQNVIAYRSRDESSGEWKSSIITMFDPSISNYHYYYPVVAGGTHSSSDAALLAWKVGAAGNYRYQKIVDNVLQGNYQSDSGWYPSVTTYLSAAHSSFTNPFIIAADGNQSPYEIEVNTAVTLPRATTNPVIYNRRIIAEYKNADSSLVFIQLGDIKVETKTGEEITLDFVPVAGNKVELTAENLFAYLNTKPIILKDAELLSFNYTVFTRSLETVLKDSKSSLKINVTLHEGTTNDRLAQVTNIQVDEMKGQFCVANKNVQVSLESFANKPVFLSMDIENLDMNKEVVFGLAHVYKDAEKSSLKRPNNTNFSTTIPTKYSLLPNFPNPFNPATIIPYTLPETAHVKLAIYDILGREVITLVNGIHTAGDKQVQWEGRDGNGHLVPNGVYIYRIEANNFSQARKLLFLK